MKNIDKSGYFQDRYTGTYHYVEKQGQDYLCGIKSCANSAKARTRRPTKAKVCGNCTRILAVRKNNK